MDRDGPHVDHKDHARESDQSTTRVESAIGSDLSARVSRWPTPGPLRGSGWPCGGQEWRLQRDPAAEGLGCGDPVLSWLSSQEYLARASQCPNPKQEPGLTTPSADR